MPDSITTWVAEAVALSEKKGLALGKRAELRTFKRFFVDFTLPYSLIRGEQTKVPLTVYNYLPTCSEVRVFLKVADGHEANEVQGGSKAQQHLPSSLEHGTCRICAFLIA